MMVGQTGRWGLAFGSALAFALLIITLAGCAQVDPVGTVEGTVLLDGEPYSDASVVFLSLDTGQGSSANLGPGGRFELPDPLPVGTYTVFMAPRAEDADAHEPQPVTMDESIPDKYWNEASSDIEITVEEGANDVRVELET